MSAVAMWAARLDVRPRFGALAGSPAGVHMRFVETTCSTLRVRDQGDRGARTVVFACDPPNVIEHYAAVYARLLPAGFRVVCFELPGFGFSSAHDPSAFSLDGVATAAAEMLAELRIEHATLAFPCVAGFVAMRLAARQPDLVASLVLSQLPSWSQTLGWIDRLDRRRLLRTPFLGQLGMRVRKRHIARAWYGVAVGDAVNRAAFLRTAEAAFAHGARFCLASLFQSMDRAPAPRFEPVAQPTLLLWGQDRSHRKTDQCSAIQHFERAEVRKVRDAGHFPELQRPDAWLEWLDGHSS